MKIWLDDLRVPPDESWAWVKTVQEATDLLKSGEVEELSLDSDLGEGIPEGRRLVLLMVEHDCWPTSEITIHRANPVPPTTWQALSSAIPALERS